MPKVNEYIRYVKQLCFSFPSFVSTERRALPFEMLVYLLAPLAVQSCPREGRESGGGGGVGEGEDLRVLALLTANIQASIHQAV